MHACSCRIRLDEVPAGRPRIARSIAFSFGGPRYETAVTINQQLLKHKADLHGYAIIQSVNQRIWRSRRATWTAPVCLLTLPNRWSYSKTSQDMEMSVRTWVPCRAVDVIAAGTCWTSSSRQMVPATLLLPARSLIRFTIRTWGYVLAAEVSGQPVILTHYHFSSALVINGRG